MSRSHISLFNYSVTRFFILAHIFNWSFHFCVSPPDDFADEEEVQSFGYKRFGKYPATSWFPPAAV